MNEKRTFIRTSSGVLHRPGCPSLKRLVLPTETIEITATERERHGTWWSVEVPVWRMAECCTPYGRTREVRSYEWAEED